MIFKFTEEKVIEYEKRITDLSGKIDEKSERLRVLELNNTRMVAINNDLERNNKKLNVAERKMQEEVRKDHLMRKQIYETPRAELPYIEDFETKDKRIGYTCKRNCMVGGQKWVDFKRDHNITIKSYETFLEFVNGHVLEHWTEFQALKEIIRSNRNQKGNWAITGLI